jgi:hypothetical protein
LFLKEIKPAFYRGYVLPNLPVKMHEVDKLQSRYGLATARYINLTGVDSWKHRNFQAEVKQQNGDKYEL